MYGVYSHHLFASQLWAVQNGIEFVDSIGGKVRDLIKYTSRDEVVAACGLIAALILAVDFKQGQFRRNLATYHRKHGFLFVALVVASIPFVLAPRPSHAQYFQPMVPFLIIAVCGVYGSSIDRFSRIGKLGLLSLFILACVPGIRNVFGQAE